MFWKIVAVMLIGWGVATFYGFTLGGFVHIVPVAAVGAALVRRLAKNPNTEFGRWRSAAQRRR
jgi:hypothetical protein